MSMIGVARHLGPWGRRWGWDRVFRKGAWFAGQRRPEFAAWARKHGRRRHVLELACGDGSLAAEVAPFCRSYVGMDVSAEAIRLAVLRAGSLRPLIAFRTGDMKTAEPGPHVRLVIIEEALYYLSPGDQARLLARCLAHAKVMITVHDAIKHAPTLAVCEGAGRIVERHQWGARVGVLIDAR